MSGPMELPAADQIRAALSREPGPEIAGAVRRSVAEAIAVTPQRRRVFGWLPLPRIKSRFKDGLVAVAGSQGGLELLDPTGAVVDRLETERVAGAAWSPDGQSLAYWNGLGASWTVDILDVRAGAVRTLTDGAGIANFAPAERHKIDPEALLHFQPALPVAWSPDGTRVLINVADGPVAIVDVETGEVSPLTGDGTIGGAAAWSPDGSRVAWYSAPGWAGEYQLSIRTLADDSTVTIAPELPDGTGYWGTFAWSPDSERLLIGAGGSGGTYLVEVDAGHGATVALHEAPDLDRILGWSPTGERVAWSTFGSRSAGTLWSMHPDGSDARQHADGVCWGGLGWSPSGRELLYTTDCQPRSEAMRVRAAAIDGGEPRVLWTLETDGTADITGVAWQGVPR